jgi:hypothetical protein
LQVIKGRQFLDYDFQFATTQTDTKIKRLTTQTDTSSN